MAGGGGSSGSMSGGAPARRAMPGGLRVVALAELWLGRRRFAFWFMAALFAAMGYFYFTRFVAVSPGEDSLTQGVKLARNSAYSLAVLLALFSFIFVHFTAALTIDPVLRDRRLGLLPLVLSSPVRGSSYVLGKFLGAFALILAVPLFFVAVAVLCQFIPNPDIGLIPPNALGLTVAYLEFYVPTVLMMAGLLFAVALWSGSPKLVYTFATFIFLGFMLLLNLVEKVEHHWMAYLDPVGVLYLMEVAKGKTNVELNAKGWMLDAGFIANRLAVVALGLGPLLLAARGFARREAMAGGRGRKLKAPKAGMEATAAEATAGAQAMAAPLRPLASGVGLALAPLRQLGRVTGAELRLLSHERSLFFLVPILGIVLWTSIRNQAGPFEAEVIPTSSQVVHATYYMILVFLFGTIAFFIGEAAHREREENLADLLHAYPAPEIAFVGGKLLATLVLAVLLVGVAIAIDILYQVSHRGGAVDLHPFVVVFGSLLLPTVFLLIALSLALSLIAGSKPGGYALFLGMGGVLVWAFIRGHRHWIYNLPAVNLLRYSDIVGFGPLHSALVLQRLYVLAIALLLVLVAAAAYPRTAGGRRSLRRAFAAFGERRLALPAGAALAAVLALGVMLYMKVETGMGSLAAERLRADYERMVKPWLEDHPEPEIAGVDLDLDLDPPRHAYALAGSFRLKNPLSAPLDSVHITVNPRLLKQGTLTLDGRPPDRFDHAVATFRLPEPLAPGGEVVLACRWHGRVPDGVPRHGGDLDTFIQPGGTYLHSFAPWPWLPFVGYNSEMEIAEDRIRRRYHLGKRETLPLDDGSGMTPGMFHQSGAFPYRARIKVPEGERVLSAGVEIADRPLAGGRREFEYASDAPLYFYPVMSGRWTEKREGASAVYHWPSHDQNEAKILDALVRSRATFSELFSPFPYLELRVAEFPRLANFAMGYPTLIPYSEGIGFLTRDPKDRTNLNFYVTAHEVAHQWWGTVIWPAHAKGSPILSEGLANYSALLMAEKFEGEAKRRKMFEDYEDRYLRRRDANEERPLVLLDGDRRRDDVLWYDRAGVVFYMMHRILGEERMLTGLREFIHRFSFRDDHPTVTDFLALYEEREPELHHFFDQFVRGKAIPNPSYSRVERTPAGDGKWRVGFEITNRGEGDLDLEVAATSGKRDEKDFREARTVVALRGAAPVAGEVVCDFKPETVEMDPGRTVLLQERQRGRRNL